MKTALHVSWFVALALSTFAADASRAAQSQTGRMSAVQLLATGRVAQTAPDGMRFLFMITRTPGTSGGFTLKETRDFTIAGQSYQEKSQAELGRRIEPSTVFDTAEGFFAKQPGARRLAPAEINGALILALNLGGAPLTSGAEGEIKLNLGFNQEVEPFTFTFTVPPSGPATQSPATGETSPRGTSGVPPVPANGRVRYVATDGIGFAPSTFDLDIADGTVSGVLYQHATDASGMSTRLVGPFEIFDGKVEGNAVTFRAKAPGGEPIVTFTGERSDGQIRFTRHVEVKPGADPGLDGLLGSRGATQFVAHRRTSE